MLSRPCRERRPSAGEDGGGFIIKCQDMFLHCIKLTPRLRAGGRLKGKQGNLGGAFSCLESSQPFLFCALSTQTSLMDHNPLPRSQGPFLFCALSTQTSLMDHSSPPQSQGPFLFCALSAQTSLMDHNPLPRSQGPFLCGLNVNIFSGLCSC